MKKAPLVLVWPTGGFQWTPEWLALLPVMRGVHLPSPAPSAPQSAAMALEAALGSALPQAYADWFARFEPLRDAVACADEAAYEAALAVAQRGRTGSSPAARACAFVFPHLGEWTAEWLAAHGKEPWGHAVLCWSAMQPADFLAHAAAHPWLDHATLTKGVLLQLKLHGEAALEVLAWFIRTRLTSRDPKLATQALKLAAQMKVPGLLPLLAAQSDHKKVRDTLEKLAKTHPVAVLFTVIRQAMAGRSRAAETWALRLAHEWPQALPAALEALEPALRARFEGAVAALNPVEAPDEAVPPILREPPWLRADRPGQLPVLEVAAIATPEALAWRQDLLERLKSAPRQLNPQRDAHGFPVELKLTDAGARRLLAGQLLQDGDTSATYASMSLLFDAPQAAQLTLWNSFPPERWMLSPWSLDAEQVLARLGVAAIPGMVAVLSTHQGKGPRIALLMDTPLLVPRMAKLLRQARIHRSAAAEWIAKFPRTMVLHALPAAFSAQHSAERDDARYTLRWMAEQAGGRTALLEAAAAYGDAMTQAATALLATDPLDILPGEMPPVPAFCEVATMRRPHLLAGGALSVAATGHLVRMLMIGQPDAPYPGVALVQAACTPASLAEFAWDLHEAWAGAGAPSKDGWAFRTLGLLGNDETARRLIPRINDWASAPGTRGRAESALDLLAAIGTDVALMLLNTQATKVRHKRVQLRAAGMISAVADARGLTLDELGDRLAPTLGLDEPDAAVFDFGPRKFSLSFDESLKPVVRDARGLRLKDLPKPLKGDDATLAGPAAERFKQLKKDVRSIASLEITRLERAMRNARRWPLPEFRRFFLAHPLMRHLATRLAWATYDGGTLRQPFRVAEDWTLADAADERLVLPEAAQIGILHVLELDASVKAQLGQLFGDYEILQPFKQLQRETYALTLQEKQQRTVKRFENRDVATGAVIGLDQKGWERGGAEDGGMVREYARDAPGGLRITLRFSPGIFVAGGVMEARQSLEWLTLARRSAEGTVEALSFDALDPVSASEMLRDIDLLNPALSQPQP